MKQLFFCKFRELAVSEAGRLVQVDLCGHPLLILLSQDGAYPRGSNCPSTI
jgi:hypothetical protein